MQCLWAQWLRKELRFKSETRVIQQFNRASRLCVLCEWCHIQAFCGKMQIIWCKCMKIWHAYNIKQEDSVGTNKNRHHMENRRLLMHNASPGCRLAEWATPHPRILWLKFLKKTQQQQKQTKKKKTLNTAAYLTLQSEASSPRICCLGAHPKSKTDYKEWLPNLQQVHRDVSLKKKKKGTFTPK